MGLSTDFVVADVGDAAAVDAAGDRVKRWPGLASGRLMEPHIARLHFVIAGRDASAPAAPPRTVRNPFTGADHVVTVHDEYSRFECLFEGEDSLVHRIPEELVRELAGLEDVRGVAERWVRCPELSPGWLEDAVALLAGLRDLARLARERGQALLVRTAP